MPACSFVIRLDQTHTTKSHIQGSGRARQQVGVTDMRDVLHIFVSAGAGDTVSCASLKEHAC